MPLRREGIFVSVENAAGAPCSHVASLREDGELMICLDPYPDGLGVTTAYTWSTRDGRRWMQLRRHRPGERGLAVIGAAGPVPVAADRAPTVVAGVDGEYLARVTRVAFALAAQEWGGEWARFAGDIGEAKIDTAGRVHLPDET